MGAFRYLIPLTTCDPAFSTNSMKKYVLRMMLFQPLIPDSHYSATAGPKMGSGQWSLPAGLAWSFVAHSSCWPDFLIAD